MKKLSLLLLCFTFGCLLTAAQAAEVPAGAKAPDPDHLVYLSFLPEPSELMADAKANGLEILRLDQKADRVIVTYKYPDGHTATLGYALLSAARDGDGVVARVQSRSTATYTQDRTVIVKDEPEVIYVEREPRTRVVYRDRYDDFWLPLTVGLGIGYISNHHHWHRPHYRHYHYRGHRHWRR